MCGSKTLKLIATLFSIAMFAAVLTPASAQKGKGTGVTKADLDKLRAEVDRLRADLDAALKEINALKAAAGGAKVAPETGPLYRGRPAGYWLDQLKDADPKTRVDAVEALGALAQNDKKLIPVLLDTAKKDKDVYVLDKAVRGLGAAGPDALPALLELLESKKYVTVSVMREIGGMGPKAKGAVPALIKSLKTETSDNMLHVAISALGKIGPEAREAIPALVEALGDCLRDIDKNPNVKGSQSRFGVAKSSMNVVVVDALKKIDPELAGAVPLRPILTEFGGGRSVTKEDQDAWRMAHEALVKRYLKPK